MPVETRHQTKCAKQSNKEARCNCSPTFRAVRYHGQGIPRTLKLFPTQAAARNWLHSAQSARQRGKDPVPTLSIAAEKVFAGMYSGAVLNKNKQRYKQTAVQTLEKCFNRHVKPELGPLRLDKIKRRTLQKLVDKLAADGVKPPTQHNAVGSVSVIYRRYIRDEIVTENPTLELEIERVRGRRERVADVGETREILEALPFEIKVLYSCAAYAGLRRGEIMGLRWSDINFEEGYINIARQYDVHNKEIIETKSRSIRRVPLLSELRDLLSLWKLQTTGDGVVFAPRAFNTLGRHTAKIWKNAGLKGITLHECRHSFASICIDAGLNLKVIGSFLGHASVTTTMDTYGHLLPGSEASAAEKMNAYLAENEKIPAAPSS